MKIKLQSFYLRFISFCLVLLGFSSCESTDPRVEYGTPSADYKVKGKVVSDTAEDPIKNIRVVMIENEEESASYLMGDTVSTDIKGEFEINTHRFPYNEFKIKFEDIDGELNGEFEDKAEVIQFQNSDYKEGVSWYKGEAEKDMGTVKMTFKKEDTE